MDPNASNSTAIIIVVAIILILLIVGCVVVVLFLKKKKINSIRTVFVEIPADEENTATIKLKR